MKGWGNRRVLMTDWIKRTFEIDHTGHRTILPMEGVRGFAVFLVFLVHYATMVGPWLKAGSVTQAVSDGVLLIGHAGVDLFFVLSGFLIYGMLISKRRPMGRYALRRVQRIYPTFAVVFATYLALSFVFPAESKIPPGSNGLMYVLANALLLPGIFDIEPMITVAWSLSYEALCYLLIPLIMITLRLRVWLPRHRVQFFVAMALGLFVVFSLFGGPIRLTFFVCGILVYELVQADADRRMSKWGLPAIVLAIGSTLLVPMVGLAAYWRFVLLFIFFFVFCVACLGGRGASARAFAYAPMRWLGNMSYSYYLIHGLALKAAFLVLGQVYPPQTDASALFWLLLPVAFAVTLVPSAVLFLCVEKPYSLTRRSQQQHGQDPVSPPMSVGAQG